MTSFVQGNELFYDGWTFTWMMHGTANQSTFLVSQLTVKKLHHFSRAKLSADHEFWCLEFAPWAGSEL